MRMTKPMATLTLKQCGDKQLIERMLKAGLKGVRINSAHVTAQQLESMVASLRQMAPGVALLVDTKGPELRTGANLRGEDIVFAPGQKIEIVNSSDPCTASRICFPAEGATSTLAQGVEMTVDDGLIAIRMLSPTIGEVTKGGVLGERKSVNLHGCEMPPMPAVSARDKDMLRLSARLGVEMVAHSFVRSAADIEAVRSELQGSQVCLLAKIETAQAAHSIREILEAADGLLVARGDLGEQISPYCIPMVQRRCAEECRRADKPMIIATQILDSMIDRPAPTRAELSDIALGTWQGADYMLLCGETAHGRWPVECVEVLDKCIKACSE